MNGDAYVGLIISSYKSGFQIDVMRSLRSFSEGLIASYLNLTQRTAGDKVVHKKINLWAAVFALNKD